MNDNSGIDDVGRGIMSVFVRLLGLTLLLAGIWIAFHVLLEAYHLYQEPQRIERFAVAIEKGSNIDKSLVSFRDSTANNDDPASATVQKEFPQSGNSVRVSYFFAWMVVLLLMLLIARISLAAIKTGGELVLYDVQIKHFARQLVKESNQHHR